MVDSIRLEIDAILRGALGWAVLSVGLTVGCGTMSARDAVELARRRWEAATGLTRGLPPIVEVHGLFQCGGRPANGCWNNRTQTLTLDVDSNILEWMATHEWGHVLGALDGHAGTLMCHELECSEPLITRFDVTTVCNGPKGPCTVEKPEG